MIWRKREPSELVTIIGEPEVIGERPSTEHKPRWSEKLLGLSIGFGFLLLVLLLGIWDWKHDASREPQRRDADQEFYDQLTARYGPKAIEQHALASIDATLALEDDKKLEGWSVVDQDGNVICKDPQAETTIRRLHCETDRQQGQPK